MEDNPRGRESVRIFLVEDHAMFRAQLAKMIVKYEGMLVCGEADNALDALTMIRMQSPDLVIVDISLRGSSGLDLIRDLKTHIPGIRVIVLSMHDESVYAERALRAGACGYIAKHQLAVQFAPAIDRVLKGEIHLSVGMTIRMLRSAPSAGTLENHPRLALLSAREAEIFQMLGLGLSTRQIAERLDIGEKTVHSHRLHIKEKLGFKHGAELYCQAARMAVMANEAPGIMEGGLRRHPHDEGVA